VITPTCGTGETPSASLAAGSVRTKTKSLGAARDNTVDRQWSTT
jgi:hypothetical protein